MKRMTETDIWSKEWFMTLEPRLKCLVRFIWDNCDNAGVWSPNWTLAKIMIGEEVSIDDIKKIDNGNKHEILKNGKIWIKDFVEFQCGKTLNPKSPPHKKVIDLLESYSLLDRVFNRVLDTPIEEEEEKEEEEEVEREEDKEAESCFEKCLIHFPEHLRPDKKQKSNWIDTIDKLNRIDKIPFEKIIEIVKKTREDQFWSKNFLSLTKLRKKNPEGVMYAVVFNENIKSRNEQSSQTGSIYSDDFKQRVANGMVAKKN